MGGQGVWRGVVELADGTTGNVTLTADPEWTQTDLDKVFAYQGRESKKCPNCRTFPDEWIKDGKPIEPYEAASVHCYGCEVLEERRRLIAADESTCEYPYLTRRKPGGTDG